MGPSVRGPAYLLERMFPRLRDRFGAALDTVVEFSTLGEYRLGASAPAPASALPADSDNRVGPISGWEVLPASSAGEDPGTVTTRRTVAGGAAALHGIAARRALLGAPAATPAARRQRRPGAPPPPEQLCLFEQSASR